MRGASPKPRPRWLEDAAHGVTFGVQVTFLSELGSPETRVLSEKPRPATPAVGAARQGRLKIRPLVEKVIAPFGELAQRVAEACPPEWLHGVGRRRKDQKQPGTISLLSLRGMPQT